MSEMGGASSRQTFGEFVAHQCNCIGCCRKCGMCRTSPNHTAAMCMLLQKQAEEREGLIKNEDRWGHKVKAEDPVQELVDAAKAVLKMREDHVRTYGYEKQQYVIDVNEEWWALKSAVAKVSPDG